MSDTSAFGFGKFVPGFDFLQNIAQSTANASPAAGGIPGMSSWVAPTLSVEELDKRIQELKAVQFWLEQNGTALKATIQALEVQKMTLSTLQGMNVNMAELARAFTAKVPAPAPATGFGSAPAPAPTPAPAPEPEPEPEPAQQAQAAAGADTGARARTQRKADSQAGAQGKAGATVDPMQWWGSLTQQFQNIAAAALQDAAAQARKAQTTAGAASARAGGKADAKGSAAQPSSRSSSARQTARKTSPKTSGKTSGTRKAAARPASPTARSPRS